MSAATFRRLIDEFRTLYATIGGKLFHLNILAPGSYSFGVEGVDPPYNRLTHELITTIGVPKTLDVGADQVCGFAVVAKNPSLPEAPTKFKRLCAEAGANLPASFRNRLSAYSTWEHAADSASWWIALMACLSGIKARNDSGKFEAEHLIVNPVLRSIELIEGLKLQTDAPEWPPSKEGDTHRESPAVVGFDLAKLDEFDRTAIELEKRLRGNSLADAQATATQIVQALSMPDDESDPAGYVYGIRRSLWPERANHYMQSGIADDGRTDWRGSAPSFLRAGGLGDDMQMFNSVLHLLRHLPRFAFTGDTQTRSEILARELLPFVSDYLDRRKVPSALRMAPLLEQRASANERTGGADASDADKKAAFDKLERAVKTAYLAYQHAESQAGKRLEDRVAWEWLNENGIKGDAGELADYELPSLDTFRTYLSKARKTLGENKYTPRGGRTGRSVTTRNQIE